MADSPTVHLSLLTHLTEAGLVSSLTCLVDSSPPATLTWARDGLEVRRVETNTSSVLELLEVRPGEAWLGNYSCTATTETDSQTASVLVTGESNVLGSPTLEGLLCLAFLIIQYSMLAFHFSILLSMLLWLQVVRWLPW